MEKTDRLLELDSLRGIAALLVVFYHLTIGLAVANYGFKFGKTGVELFFLISGFVIFLTIEKTIYWKDFIWSRFVRLYPTYWACVTITTISILCWEAIVKAPMDFPKFADYLANLTMFQYWLNVKNIDGVYWTLTLELCFYLFILIVFFLQKLNKIETIGYFIVFICLLNALFPQKLLPLFLPISGYFPLFIAGIVFYKIKFEQINLPRILLLLLCLTTQIFSTDYYEITKLQYAVILIFYFILFFLYLYGYLHFIVNKATVFLGRISYSLYLTHGYIAFHIIIPFLTHSKRFHLNQNVAVFCIAFPFVIVLAFTINRWIEVPAMKYLKSFRKKKALSNRI